MSGATVAITVDDAAVKAALERLTAALQSPAAALRDVGEYLLRSTDEHFRRQAGPDGTPWPQLADITLMRRLARVSSHGGFDGKPVGYLTLDELGTLAAQRGTMSKRKTKTGGRTLTAKGRKLLANAKILRDSGALQDTIRYQLTAAGQGVEVGTDRIYGAMQQFGGTRASWPHLWGDIPPRPYLGLDAADRAEILAIFEHHLAP